MLGRFRLLGVRVLELHHAARLHKGLNLGECEWFAGRRRGLELGAVRQQVGRHHIHLGGGQVIQANRGIE